MAMVSGPPEVVRAKCLSLLRGGSGIISGPQALLRARFGGLVQCPLLSKSSEWTLRPQFAPLVRQSQGDADKASVAGSDSDSGDGSERSVPDVSGGATLPEQVDWREDRKAYSWIRFNNSSEARELRREAATETCEVTRSKGYYTDSGYVRLRRVKAMLRGTRRYVPSGPASSRSPSSGPPTEVTTHQGVMLQVAMELAARHGDKVGVVSAASAFHMGGGFLTGGRHALEEACCMQTTLFESLANLEPQVSTEEYIPVDGVILSPFVEIFRRGSDEGYPFMDAPVQLAAVISMAMYNRNPDMRDAPVDAPEDERKYDEGVRAKMRAVLAAAVEAGCRAVVMPDAGCGVYKNDPKVVGRIFGEVLRAEFWGQLEEVALVGSKDFKQAAVDGAKVDVAIAASSPGGSQANDASPVSPGAASPKKKLAKSTVKDPRGTGENRIDAFAFEVEALQRLGLNVHTLSSKPPSQAKAQLRAIFSKDVALRAQLVGSGDALLLVHTAKGDKPIFPNAEVWTDGGNGSGQNLLGAQCMLLRDEFLKKRDWTDFLVRITNEEDTKDASAMLRRKTDSSSWRAAVRAAAKTNPGRPPLP